MGTHLTGPKHDPFRGQRKHNALKDQAVRLLLGGKGISNASYANLEEALAKPKSWIKAELHRLKKVIEAGQQGVRRVRPLNWVPATPEEREVLRQKALKKQLTISKIPVKRTEVNRYERNPTIRKYVLARAGIFCESCGQEAQHYSPSGAPLLECHHIIKVSLDGPDGIQWVAAIHPNCHDALHRGATAKEDNQKLKIKLQELEGRL